MKHEPATGAAEGNDVEDPSKAITEHASAGTPRIGMPLEWHAMASHVIRARAARGSADGLVLRRDPDVLTAFSEDAAHFPDGRLLAVATPTNEAEIVRVLQTSSSVLAIGAQSSLTGGATPMGDVVLSTSRMNRILDVLGHRVRAQPGVTLTDLDTALRRTGHYYPPAPTFAGAFVGGIVATNAAGAATFKYGATRSWVEALTVVLASGDVLDVERGVTRAHPDGYFEIELADRRACVPVPRYRMPEVPKLAAGYFAAPGMDLIDLFVGSEGTLGIISEVTLRVVRERPSLCLAFVPLGSRRDGIGFVTQLRNAARATWRSRDSNGLDVSAIEHMDARCLALLREDGADRQFGLVVPDAEIALLVTLELTSGMTAADAFDQIGRFRDLDTGLTRFCRALDDIDALDRVELAVPGDDGRAAQLLGLREAVPAAVNARVGRAKANIDSRITKTAADMIVPFERLEEILTIYDDGFRRRGLDAAVWGHISDGNLHPNVIPTSYRDVEKGKDAILEFGREAIRLGGSPLAEHGVGRHPVKQALLQDLYGSDGIDEMRAVKRTLDPDFKLAPGVIFSK
jgi:D-lactate dehydrogenase (cytochrome)